MAVDHRTRRTPRVRATSVVASMRRRPTPPAPGVGDHIEIVHDDDVLGFYRRQGEVEAGIADEFPALAGTEDASGVAGAEETGEEGAVAMFVGDRHAVEALVVGDEGEDGVVVLVVDGGDHQVVGQASALTLVMRSARLAGMTS